MKLFLRIQYISLMILFSAVPIIFSGCSAFKSYWNIPEDIIGASYNAADELLKQITPPILPDEPVLVGSFVNIDDMEESSTFGRSVSEFMASRLTRLGVKVIELKMTESVYIKEKGGEFFLSRKVKMLSKAHQAKVVFAGTYSTGSNRVYVSAKAINPEDGVLLAAHEFSMSMDADVRRMIKGSEFY